MKPKISFCVPSLILIGLSNSIFLHHTCNAQSATTSITLNVIKIDRSGERPLANTIVYILPKNQGVARGRTDNNGTVRFEFVSTESVVFRIGAGGGQHRTEPLSGRFDQNTSYIIDWRRPVYSAVSAEGWGNYFAQSALPQLISDIQNQSGGRFMNGQTREFVMQLRQEAILATEPQPNMTPAERNSILQARESILSQIDDLLAPPWKIGATYEMNPSGAKLVELDPNGPAAAAGFQVGDTVISVDQQLIAESPESLKFLVGNAWSQNIELEVVRNQQRITRTVIARR